MQGQDAACEGPGTELAQEVAKIIGSSRFD
jgi:hypothetical protein